MVRLGGIANLGNREADVPRAQGNLSAQRSGARRPSARSASGRWAKVFVNGFVNVTIDDQALSMDSQGEKRAHSTRKIPHNPAVDVVIEKPEPAAGRRFATYEQRDRLVEVAEDDHLKLFLILGFHFGLRRREIDHALPSWIDLEQRLLRVRNLIRPDPPLSSFRIKNGKERTIPMSEEATEFFERYLPKVPSGTRYLLHPEKLEGGANRYRYDMRRPFQEHIKRHGMEWLSIQGMRTTFASLLATTGLVSIQQIADWLGDTIKVTEDRYAHLLPRHDLIEKAFRDRVHHSGKSSNLRRSTAATKSSAA